MGTTTPLRLDRRGILLCLLESQPKCFVEDQRRSNSYAIGGARVGCSRRLGWLVVLRLKSVGCYVHVDYKRNNTMVRLLLLR